MTNTENGGIPSRTAASDGLTADSRRAPDARDYTKSAIYAWTDLGAKLLSAIALVVLGLIGWRLQSRAQDAKEAVEKLDRQQRKYLPMLRSLMELEVVLDDAIAAIRNRSPHSDRILRVSTDDADLTLGNGLRDTAYLVFVPDGDPLVGIRLQTLFGGSRGPGNEVRVPLRASALMLSDILRAQADLHNGTARLDMAIGAVQITRNDQTRATVFVTPDAIPAWRALLGNRSEWSRNLQSRRCLMIAQDLRFGIGQVIRDTLVRNPELGDRYVTMRNDLAAKRFSTAKGSQ